MAGKGRHSKPFPKKTYEGAGGVKNDMEVDGIPSWDGSSTTWTEYMEQVEWYIASCKP